MNINDFIKEVHQNAKDHGWWDTDRSICETISLIHSEWSEALEEARADRPMVYESYNYAELPGKPEGIAVELMDGVIRILDLYGKYGFTFTRNTVKQITIATKNANPLMNKNTPLVEIVMAAHSLTSKAGDAMVRGFQPRFALAALEACAGVVMWWVEAQGIDPEKVLLEKHEYNTKRPYKHGKKF